MREIVEIFKENKWKITKKETNGNFTATCCDNIVAQMTSNQLSMWYPNFARVSANREMFTEQTFEEFAEWVAKNGYSEQDWVQPDWSNWAKSKGWRYKNFNHQWIAYPNGMGSIIMKANGTTKMIIDGKRVFQIRGSIDKDDLQFFYELGEIIIHSMRIS